MIAFTLTALLMNVALKSKSVYNKWIDNLDLE